MPCIRQFRVRMRNLKSSQSLLIVAALLQNLSQIKAKFSIGRLEENCFSEVLDSLVLLAQFRIHLSQSRLVIGNRWSMADGLLQQLLGVIQLALFIRLPSSYRLR